MRQHLESKLAQYAPALTNSRTCQEFGRNAREYRVFNKTLAAGRAD
ncbi:hypothetical protein NYP20_09875 [Pseudomonas sp. N3-W]|nr:hypothetical protein [Pseudomonas sp. N3-W]UWF51250.1 hypothetical protein NYP20_09875 [Pseudomonas sp. N3-W]